MKRYVVECDICEREVNIDWYEVKANYIFLAHGMKTTRREKMVICCDCKKAFVKMIRNGRAYT